MSYYEELGLEPTASPAEIRAAYKRLARLLHPDQQTDEELRFLAERQMKRLNHIFEILMDPVQRRAYDQFWSGAGPAGGLFDRYPRLRDAALLAAGVALAAGLIWMVPEQTPAAPPSAPQAAVREPAPAPPPTAEAFDPAGLTRLLRTELAELRRELERVRTQRDAAVRELTVLRHTAEPLPPAERSLPPPEPAASAPLADVSETPVFPPPSLRTSTAIPIPAPPPSLTGSWVYVPPRTSLNRPVPYTAEYVELVVVQQDGILKGRYRGRYYVPDRPISPEVAFYFEGAAGGQEAVLPWSGPGSAKGEVRLRLVSADRLQIDWFATELGSKLGLASGSSLLTRRRSD
ncbi:MAG: J domain-containing protein [Bryobacteraceae bacterium]|nr:J domain-containing protein [Bryobacteraceae bacterium]